MVVAVLQRDDAAMPALTTRMKLVRLPIRASMLGGESPPIHVTLGTRVQSATRSYEIVLEGPEAEREIRLRL